MKNKNKKETAEKVLTPTEKTVELIQEAPAKAKRKHYHKPKAKQTIVAIETPVIEAKVEIKKSWLQTKFPRFYEWLNKK